MELAKAYVQIVPSAKGISGSISNALGGEAESAGTQAGTSIAGKIKSAIIAAGIGKIISSVFSSAITEGGKLEQRMHTKLQVFQQINIWSKQHLLLLLFCNLLVEIQIKLLNMRIGH